MHLDFWIMFVTALYKVYVIWTFWLKHVNMRIEHVSIIRLFWPRFCPHHPPSLYLHKRECKENSKSTTVILVYINKIKWHIGIFTCFNSFISVPRNSLNNLFVKEFRRDWVPILHFPIEKVRVEMCFVGNWCFVNQPHWEWLQSVHCSWTWRA
jgi:hypothetical protein